MEPFRSANDRSGTAAGDFGPAPIPEAGQETWRDLIDQALVDLQCAVLSRLRVAALETAYALQVSRGALVLGAVVAVMFVTAWFALVAAAVIWAIGRGVDPKAVLLILAAACVLLGWLALRAARGAIARVGFPATRRVFGGGPDSPDVSPGSSR